MRHTRRTFWTLVAAALAAAVGCDSKKDSTPNPDLGPAPTGQPPKRGAAPGQKKN